jgi:predicted chitinase
MDVNNLPQPPEGVLDSKNPWYNAEVGQKTWTTLKDKLTGRKASDGRQYISTVNLSEADADRLIENLKKDPRGYPQFDNYSDKFDENYEKYQKWLVDEYLEKPFRKQTDKKIEEAEINRLFTKSTATATKVPPKSSALVPVGKKNEDLVDEKIDERILRILGLDDVIDIDYGTYKSLLKEQSVLISTEKSKLPREEEMLIQEEFKRIKSKVGRFKVERKKITADNVRFTKPSNFLRNNFLLKGTSAIPDIKNSEEKKGPIEDIQKALDDILKSIVDQDKQDRKNAENERKKKEANKRKGIEEGMEKRFGAVQKIAQKLLSPVKSILDKIIDFFVSMLIGKVIYNLIDWIGKKENQDKLKSVLRFFKDYWPALLSAYFLFGTTLGGFIRTISGILIRGIAQFAAANPLAAGIIAGAAVMTGVGINQINQKKDRREQLFGKEDQSKPTQKSKEQQTKEGIITSTIEAGSFGAGQMAGLAGGGLLNVRQFFDNGGKVSGESGIDKIPAMLSDGEFVMSRGAVQKFGVNTLESMNAMGGGTNRPRILEGNTYAAGGGLIGNSPESKIKNPSRSIPSTSQEYSKLTPIELKFASRAKQRGITDPIELKAFLSQVKHESGGNFGEPQREKYNSSPNDPPGKPGYEYFKPYANTSGLGNRNADDAYKYIGRGYLQVTGRANYEDIGKRIGKDLVRNPTLLMNKDIALDASIEYWKSRVRPNVKNWNNTFQVSKAVNKPAAVSPDEITGMSDREDAFRGYSSIPNKTFTNLKTDVAIKPKPTIKKEPSLIDRLGSIFLPRPAIAGESTIAPTKLNPSVNQITPPISSQPRVIVIPASKKSKPSSGNPKSQSVPNFSAIHPDGNSRTAKTLGIN